MDDQLTHYQNKLAYEIDSWDLKVALEAKENVIVIDARSSEAYAGGHISGAVSIPHRQMSQHTTAHLDKSALVVTYCDGYPVSTGTSSGAESSASCGCA